MFITKTLLPKNCMKNHENDILKIAAVKAVIADFRI